MSTVDRMWIILQYINIRTVVILLQVKDTRTGQLTKCCEPLYIYPVIRKCRNQKEIPSQKTEVGKN